MSQRVCPCCGSAIVGHPNKRFCDQKCKDRHHNAQPHRIDRARQFARPAAPSGFQMMLERKIARRNLIHMVDDENEPPHPSNCDCYSCTMGPEDDF